MSQPYIMTHTIFFNETNAVGGVVYFSNFIKWQGMAREKYFVDTVQEWPALVKTVAAGTLNMTTVEEHSYFLGHAFFGDVISISLTTFNIRAYSFNMLFEYANQKGEKIYEGWQKLAFDDFKGNYVHIPPPMLNSVKSHLFEADSNSLKKIKI